jgi:hypothetical protein
MAAGQEQRDGPNAETVEYKAGQVWTTNLGMEVTVLGVEDLHKVGNVVHVRIDKIPLPSCGGIHLTRTIEHLALTEKMMRKSGLELQKKIIDLPESYLDAYREWEQQKKREIVKVPIQQAILANGTVSPIICNFLPSET